MKSIRLTKNWPNRHPDFEMECTRSPDLYKGKGFNDYQDFDFVLLSITNKIVDVDDFSSLQQRYYIKGVAKEKILLDYSIIKWTKTAQPSVGFEEIVYVYEINKTKKETT